MEDDHRQDDHKQDDHRLVQERKKKLQDLKDAGIETYPTKYVKEHSAKEILTKYKDFDHNESDEHVTIAGRIVGLRAMGKAAFCHVQDASGKIQVYFREDNLNKKYAIVKKLDFGDIIGVKGTIFKTKTGEISIKATSVSLLTKSLFPFPEKFHGFKDQELRYRMRYLDLIMNPEVKDTFLKRSQIISAMREFLTREGFIEVETPILQPIYGGTNAKPFKSKLNALDMDVFMRISNEMYLKRLIVGGYEKIFEFSQDFRNEGIDRTHNPEFLQMETMYAYANYEDNMEFFERMIEYITLKVHNTTKVTYGDHTIDFKRPWKRITMVDAIREKLGSLPEHLELEELRELAQEAKIEGADKMIWGELLEALFEHHCEEHFIQPTIVYDFPADTSPLAKKKPSDPRFVERFEPMVNGWELGNVYSELNDPAVLRENWEAQRKKIEAGDAEAQPMDEDFIRALEIGMPPTSGIGIGMDRLVMLLTNSATIRDVIFFPFMKKEK
jgi:lysyl-tRNA synthetase class 2